MDEIASALNSQIDEVGAVIEKLSAELKSGFTPAYNHFIGFFHAIDWKETWLICLISFHVVLLLVTIIYRRNINFQMWLFFLALAGIYLAEILNSILATNWKSFASQNYFDRSGLFFSVLWSWPLLVIAMIILVNTLFSLCYLVVRWKKAELRHRAHLAHNKED